MKKIYFIYKITNKVNGKSYVGKHETYSVDDDYFGSGKILRIAIKKYGKENFHKEIIEFCDNSKDLCDKEIFWIRETNSFCPNGYNINSGGKGGDNFTYNPNKELIREKIKNRPPRIYSEEERKHRSNIMSGRKLKPHDKMQCEFCDKSISKANYNRWHGDNCKLSPSYKKKEYEKVSCEFCQKKVSPQIHGQYHGVYCKNNPNRIIKDFSYKRNSDESIRKGVETRKKNGSYKQSDESNRKRSEKLKGTIKTDDTKEKMSLSNKKKWKRIKEKGESFVCEHCGKLTNLKTNYLRWHGVNCKKINGS